MAHSCLTGNGMVRQYLVMGGSSTHSESRRLAYGSDAFYGILRSWAGKQLGVGFGDLSNVFAMV